jgi:hypothetical protein
MRTCVSNMYQYRVVVSCVCYVLMFLMVFGCVFYPMMMGISSYCVMCTCYECLLSRVGSVLYKVYMLLSSV